MRGGLLFFKIKILNFWTPYSSVYEDECDCGRGGGEYVVVVVVVVAVNMRMIVGVGADVKLLQLTKSPAGQMRWAPNLQIDLNHRLILRLKVAIQPSSLVKHNV